MKEIKIPFGRTLTGRMISVDEVDRGLACACFCVSCEAALVACKGEKNQHHFRHHVEPKNCIDARETALHKFAKQLICEARQLRLPDDLDLGYIQNASNEIWLDGIRPDVLLEYDELVAIEIFVAHRVPPEKIRELTNRQLATLEIDLSFYQDTDKSDEEWRDIILRTAPRFWLFPPTIVRQEIAAKAREAAEQAVAEARQAAEKARRIYELQQYREYQDRQDREFQKTISEEMRRRENEQTRFLVKRKVFDEQRRMQQKEQERAEDEYERYRVDLENQERRAAAKFDPLCEGLKMCADTKRYFEEWEKRKAESQA